MEIRIHQLIPRVKPGTHSKNFQWSPNFYVLKLRIYLSTMA
ncbi:hypothetical Protein YC6258_01336 [Gynuella sunshinyii YC6258]|uniref:Uncharacterized protein n=1 Tax=Gynuella sunshinyii YC6258 TaxID=1445510 RepID=A0A0C5VST8_9GAMM|nr:hypothetical Protein YC6258_01336 [Gynuella sunshinyii YC6258]